MLGSPSSKTSNFFSLLRKSLPVVSVFYNEWEKYPAAWLRSLAEAGCDAEGEQ